jgi:hypothetical protein
LKTNLKLEDLGIEGSLKMNLKLEDKLNLKFEDERSFVRAMGFAQEICEIESEKRGKACNFVVGF